MDTQFNKFSKRIHKLADTTANKIDNLTDSMLEEYIKEKSRDPKEGQEFYDRITDLYEAKIEIRFILERIARNVENL